MSVNRVKTFFGIFFGERWVISSSNTIYILNCFLRREAKKGQGMKSLAGFGAAPQAGFRAAALTFPIQKTQFQSRLRSSLRLKRWVPAKHILSTIKGGS